MLSIASHAMLQRAANPLPAPPAVTRQEVCLHTPECCLRNRQTKHAPRVVLILATYQRATETDHKSYTTAVTAILSYITHTLHSLSCNGNRIHHNHKARS
jgi:hypothetical protein